MTRATVANGSLRTLYKCYIVTPDGTINLKIVPEITDSKSANYQNESIIGRSNPVTNYAYSEPRTISTELTFMITTCQDITDNLTYLRLIESLVYPGAGNGGAPYLPPSVCKIKCGKLLGDDGVCVVLKSYSVRFASDVAWDAATYLPYKFTVSCQWEVVHACSQLPTNCMIRVAGNYMSDVCTSGASVNIDWMCPPKNTDG